VKENLCGRYVMETVKKLPKIKPVCNALCYVSCHLKTMVDKWLNLGKMSGKVHECQESSLIKQGNAKGN